MSRAVHCAVLIVFRRPGEGAAQTLSAIHVPVRGVLLHANSLEGQIPGHDVLGMGVGMGVGG